MRRRARARHDTPDAGLFVGLLGAVGAFQVGSATTWTAVSSFRDSPLTSDQHALGLQPVLMQPDGEPGCFHRCSDRCVSQRPPCPHALPSRVPRQVASRVDPRGPIPPPCVVAVRGSRMTCGLVRCRPPLAAWANFGTQTSWQPPPDRAVGGWHPPLGLFVGAVDVDGVVAHPIEAAVSDSVCKRWSMEMGWTGPGRVGTGRVPLDRRDHRWLPNGG